MTFGGFECGVRQWEARDRLALLPFIQDCLAVNHEAGADMLPTERNAFVLWQIGLQAAAKGEPCLVADMAERGIVGYTLWCELPNPLAMDMSTRVLHGLGTYVVPDLRQSGLSNHLRNVAEAQATRLGFGKITGTAYHDVGLKSVVTRGFQTVGVLVEKRL